MDRDIGPKFGKRLRELREARGMTQVQLGERVSKSVEAISNMERGKTLPGLLTVTHIASTLAVPLTDLFAFDEPAPAKDALSERIAHRVSLMSEPNQRLVADFIDLLDRHRREA